MGNYQIEINAVEKARERLRGLLYLQKLLEQRFGAEKYNIFVFGSYVTTNYVEGKSDIDLAIYTDDFDLYKKISLFLEEYFEENKISSDIFFIDLSMPAPLYCAPLKSKVQFTDYYPEKLQSFFKECQNKLDENIERIAG